MESATFSPRALRAADQPLVWIDCEMTGLDYHTDQILEIAILVTNGNLDIVDPKGFRMAVKTEKAVLDKMDAWCVEQHGRSGLTAECLAAPYNAQQVEAFAMQYLKAWIPQSQIALLAGSTVYADRMFLVECMPSLVKHLHYRLLDVSSVKELCKRWFPKVAREGGVDTKNSNHRALDDIRGSISELKYYRENIFKDPQAS